jgi:negative regulator of flagellin synthesis FlgM
VKIGPNNFGSGPGSAVNGTSADGKQSAATSPLSTASNVRISDLSARLAGAEANISAGAPFDVKKVEDIKAAITGGKFRVNPEAVADKLIAHVQEMLGGQARQ